VARRTVLTTGGGIAALDTIGLSEIGRPIETSRYHDKHLTSSAGGVQAAVNAASDGDTVVVDDLYTEWNVSVTKNIDVVAGGGGQIGLVAQSGDSGAAFSFDADLDGVTIRGLFIDGKRNSTDAITWGIKSFGQNLNDITVENCTFESLYHNAIELKSKGSDVTLSALHIRGNHFEDIRRHPCFIGADSDAGFVRESIIEGNTVRVFATAGSIGLTFYGSKNTESARCERVAINDNVLYGPADGASWCIAFEGNIHHGVASGNVCYDAKGIVANGNSKDISITGNTIWKPHSSGIDIGDSTGPATLAGNIIYDTAGGGISGNDVGRITATGNYIEKSNNNAINNLTIAADNLCYDVGTNGVSNGIGECDVVVGNRVEQAHRSGILANTGNQLVVGNYCLDCDMGNNDSFASAGIVTRSTQNVIVGNVCYDSGAGNQKYGVSGDGSSNDQNIVAANMLRNNINAGINSPGPNSTIENNQPQYYLRDKVITFSGGGTQTVPIWDSDVNDQLEVEVRADSDPGNNVGFTVDSLFWDTSSSIYRVRVTETENAGGGDARIQAKRW
jgi:hypothetical protein